MGRTILLLALVFMVGCYSVPANMAVNIDRHDKNVHKLHVELEAHVSLQISSIDAILRNAPLTTDGRAELVATLKELRHTLLLLRVDKKLSEKINAWGKKNSDPEEFARIQAERAAAAGGD